MTVIEFKKPANYLEECAILENLYNEYLEASKSAENLYKRWLDQHAKLMKMAEDDNHDD